MSREMIFFTLMAFRIVDLKCGPQTCSISITWELVRNVDSQVPPRTY